MNKILSFLFVLLLFPSLVVPVPIEAQREKKGLEIRSGWKSRVQPRAEAVLSLSASRTALLPEEATIVTGTLKVPVLLVQFPERALTFSSGAIEERMYGSPQDIMSVREYYRQMSNGVFEVTGRVTPFPVTLPFPSSHYVGDRSQFGIADNLEGFLKDVLIRTSSFHEWGQYDNDGPDGKPDSGDDDGKVDVLQIIFSGQDGACAPEVKSGQMWSHRWNLTEALGAAFTTADPGNRGGKILIDDYIVVPELDCNIIGLATNGTLIHELGHVLGLPDLYAVDNPVSEGVGYFDLMGTGNYSTSAFPTSLGAWSRYVLGWVEGISVGATNDYILEPVNTRFKVAVVSSIDGSELILLENRTKTTRADKFLPAEGMLIWKIDKQQLAENWIQNRVNADPNAPGVALIQADGKRDLEEGRNRGDTSDSWPTATRTDFTPQTTPAALKSNGEPLGFILKDVKRASGNIVFDVEFDSTQGYMVKLSSVSTGVRLTVNDSVVTLPFAKTYPTGTALRLELLTQPESDTRHVFEGWSDGNQENPRTLIVGSDTINLSIKTRKEYKVSVGTSDVSLGTVIVRRGEETLSSDTWVSPGTKVQIQALPKEAGEFLFWEGRASQLSLRETASIPSDTILTLTEGGLVLTSVFRQDGEREYDASSAITSSSQSPTSLSRYVDAMGNGNGRVDVGDIVVGLKAGYLRTVDGRVKLLINHQGN